MVESVVTDLLDNQREGYIISEGNEQLNRSKVLQLLTPGWTNLVILPKEEIFLLQFSLLKKKYSTGQRM